MLAYTAILKCSLLALRARNLRMKPSSGHHRLAMESLHHTLGVPVEDVDYLCDLAQMRNDDMYESTPASDSDISEAIDFAARLSDTLDAWLREKGLLVP
ncbi:MAG: hypothetical protein PHV11_03370 [Candidatus Bipolaricaulis sp.]|nr:hypothetical protein [Candidatus Bipolaricaulis sp.]